jgi:hypothetical protein
MNLDLDDDSVDALRVLLLRHAGHNVQIPADAGMSGPEPLAPNGIRGMIDLQTRSAVPLP